MQTDITFSLAQTVWLIGGVTAIAAFVSWLMKPIKKLEDHETRIKTLESTAGEEKDRSVYDEKHERHHQPYDRRIQHRRAEKSQRRIPK